MRLERLFHVLVVMAATPELTACESTDDERRDDKIDGSAMSTTDAGPLAPCFCDTETCCDRSSNDPHVLDGFECCWSTTCP